MPRYALIAWDAKTGTESLEALRVYPQPLAPGTVRLLENGRPALRPVVEIAPVHDPATHAPTGAVSHAVLADRVEETRVVAPLTDAALKERARPDLEATVDALIQVVDLLAQRYRARVAWLGERGVDTADRLSQESLDVLTAWRDSRRADPVAERGVGEHVPGSPLGT